MRRTKIICTLGPATSSREMILKLVLAGMNVARVNLSHGNHEEHRKLINIVKDVRSELGIPLAIMLDTKGPEIRICDINPLSVVCGQRIRFVKVFEVLGEIPISPFSVIDQMNVGMNVLINDGYIQGVVVAIGNDFVEIEIHNDGIIKKNNGVVIPDVIFDIPDITESDMVDIRFGCKEGVEIVAASFINSAKQLLAIKEFISNECKSKIIVIAKIESRRGVDNFDEILQVADGIMVARGDLGLEFPIARVPTLQKKIIEKSNCWAKPVITATQMLESMITNPLPTRAEVSDVANAIYDSTSAVMLSAESAIGKYPVEAVKMMHNIIIESEMNYNYIEYLKREKKNTNKDIQFALALAAVNISYSIEATAIVVCSLGGHTVRRICCNRPKALILVVTPSTYTYHQTSIMWGTEAVMEKVDEIEKGLQDILSFALKKKWVNYGDQILVTMGRPYGVSLTTNTLMIESVGNVVVRGESMRDKSLEPIVGEVYILTDCESTNDNISNKIVVATLILKKYIPFLKNAKGIILQNHHLDVQSEQLLQQLYDLKKIPFISKVDGATFLLKNKMQVRLHPSQGLVFNASAPTYAEMLT